MSMSAVDYSGVLAELAEAAKAARDDPEIDYLQGKAYAGMGRTQDAVTALKRAIELNPLDPSPYYQLGLAYEELGQTELARQTLERMQHLKQTSR